MGDQDKSAEPEKRRPAAGDRAAREAAALRANLARRKAQRRGRDAAAASSPEAGPDDDAEGP